MGHAKEKLNPKTYTRVKTWFNALLYFIVGNSFSIKYIYIATVEEVVL